LRTFNNIYQILDEFLDQILLRKGTSFDKMKAKEIEKNENFLIFKDMILNIFQGKVTSVISLEKVNNTTEFGCKYELL